MKTARSPTARTAVHSSHFCEHGLARRSAGKQATDRTRYGLARVSTKSFYVHHMQRMSTAAVMHDARAIRHQVTCKKQKALQVAQAAVTGGA